MILVTGAGGKTGRALIQCLAARGQSTRGLVRNRRLGQLLRTLGAQETVVADMQDQAAWSRAMHEIRSVYHICPNMHPQEVEIGERAIRAALQSGVEHFVFHSVLHPQVEAMPHHWSKMRVEERLFQSGLAFTILQPAPYMQNLEASWPQILRDDFFEVPYAAGTKLNMVDLQDFAEAAARVLLGTEYRYGTYEICGPENLSLVEVSRIVSEYLERAIQVEVLSVDSWASRARRDGLNEYAVNTLEEMFIYYAQNDLVGSPRELEWILGRPPTRLEAYLRRLPQH